MAKRIIWTPQAKSELIEIFEYWNARNGSKRYSVKLNNLIIKTLDLLVNSSEIGRITDIENIRVKLINRYLLYYEIISDDLYILSIRHEKRDPKTLKFK